MSFIFKLYYLNYNIIYNLLYLSNALIVWGQRSPINFLIASE
jgi:hypothetical protein